MSELCLAVMSGVVDFPPRCRLTLGHYEKKHKAWAGSRDDFIEWEDSDDRTLQS